MKHIPENVREWLVLLAGFVGALKLALASVGLHFYTQEQADTFIAAIEALIPLVIVSYAVYKNTYVVTDKAKKEKEILNQAKEEEK